MEQVLKNNEHFIYYPFNLTAGGLYLLSMITELSYQFWNILIWFGMLPAIWIGIISRKTTVWLNLISVVLLGYLFIVHTWVNWFNKSVILLNKMSDFFHSDYKSMSVYVCVFLPLLVLLSLSWLCLSRKTNKWILIGVACVCVVITILFPASNAIISDYVNFKEPRI